ncbi:hypothetical protein FOL47_001900 [Perkinsus chesapeaki]|uniref:N-acetyltransferase domain-containing protein n=1 Tax=Perkinsus chesapeaki TaxID=330153 RepID=A0A7J6MGB4_PERCH|nr:hypothetical protein FOL47_001900 [Perkinsus chesapeaki]
MGLNGVSWQLAPTICTSGGGYGEFDFSTQGFSANFEVCGDTGIYIDGVKAFLSAVPFRARGYAYANPPFDVGLHATVEDSGGDPNLFEIALNFVNTINSVRNSTQTWRVFSGVSFHVHDIVYRDYIDGDKYDDPDAGFGICRAKATIPCYVAIDGSKSNHTVVGFIKVDIPFGFTAEEQTRFEERMKDPKKKGDFGYIHTVEVIKDHRRKGIGRKLVTHAIDLGKRTKNTLAMVLFVNEEDTGPIQLYQKLHFIRVMKTSMLYMYAYYYVPVKPTLRRIDIIE